VGDYVQIPAGTPHLVNPKPGTRMRYLVFNARQ
jgi:quercetin dioxygenase-like cupin family protein